MNNTLYSIISKRIQYDQHEMHELITSHVDIYYEIKSFYVATCLSIPLKDNITYNANYYFDRTNFLIVNERKVDSKKTTWNFLESLFFIFYDTSEYDLISHKDN